MVHLVVVVVHGKCNVARVVEIALSGIRTSCAWGAILCLFAVGADR